MTEHGGDGDGTSPCPHQTGISSLCHQLGIVAHLRGDFATAERSYQRSIKIKDALGNRPGMAGSYHQLGMVAQDRGELDGAERRYHRALEINEALAICPTLPALTVSWVSWPRSAATTRQLSIGRFVASHCSRNVRIGLREESWQRCVGNPLPHNIREILE